MKWISIKERLPKLDDEVLFLSQRDGIQIGYMGDKNPLYTSRKRKNDPEILWINRDDGCCSGVDLNPTDVTHWMPLPEKPDEPT